MKPQKSKIDYEKVKTGELISGTIDKIERDENHKSTYQGQERIYDAIRFVFQLTGYSYPHRSRWMTFSYNEKSTLYQKYISKLVENAEPEIDMDIEILQGCKVKTIWSEKDGYQSIDAIYPDGAKVKAEEVKDVEEEVDETGQQVPF